MARYEDMLPTARVGLTQAPDRVIVSALRRAAMELCRQSQVWRMQLDEVAARDGVYEYDFDGPDGATVERIIWLKYDGRKIDPHGRDDELLGMPASTGVPRCYAQSATEQTFLVWPRPTAKETGLFQAYVALKPARNAATLPDFLVEKYEPGIVAMAKAELMATSPGMPYHNVSEAQVQGAIGASWIAAAKRVQHSGNFAPLAVKPRPFA